MPRHPIEARFLSHPIICPSCGAPVIKPDARFCTSCGAPLDGAGGFQLLDPMAQAPGVHQRATPAAQEVEGREDGLDFFDPMRDDEAGGEGWDSTPLPGFQMHGSIVTRDKVLSGNMSLEMSGLRVLSPKGVFWLPYSAIQDFNRLSDSKFEIYTTDGRIYLLKGFKAHVWLNKLWEIVGRPRMRDR
ncbi:MAG: zinc ribbon domain-containing protein [Candidatus Lokiarchaeota archaeon]|nr:zinc ribbon domain-containing protein [Candidatus Lokiarchaeota archaeon]